MAKPIIVGRPAVVEMRLKKIGSRLKAGLDFEIVNPEDDPRYQQCWRTYHEIGAREGVTPEIAKAALRKFNTLIGAIIVRLGDADGMICGRHRHLSQPSEVHRPGAWPRTARRALRRDEPADAAGTQPLHLRHLRQ